MADTLQVTRNNSSSLESYYSVKKKKRQLLVINLDLKKITSSNKLGQVFVGRIGFFLMERLHMQILLYLLFKLHNYFLSQICLIKFVDKLAIFTKSN